MADIRNPTLFSSSRWDWDKHRYSDCFGGAVTPGDIDAVIERRGRFLWIEQKNAATPDEATPDSVVLPEGQRIMYDKLRKATQSPVLVIAGNAQKAVPYRIHQMGHAGSYFLGDDFDDSDRRGYLMQIFRLFWHWAEHQIPGPFTIPPPTEAPF